MKPKMIVRWAVAAVLFLVVGLVIWKRVTAGRDAAEFQEQLKLASAEGIPTTAAEFAATITPAKPEENAAPLYRQLLPAIKPLGDFENADLNLLSNPNLKTLGAAKSVEQKAKAPLAIMDAASKLPRCWFDRNWSDGAAVLLPEFAQMKAGAKLIALRGSIAAAEGRVKDALKDADKILVVSKHAGEEGTELSALVSEAIYYLDLRDLASWCVQHPEVTAYREALAKYMKSAPTPDLKREHRDRLWLILDLITLSETPQGRTKLGLKPEDVGVATDFSSIFMNQSRARIEIVKDGRDYWAALSRPADEMSKTASNALEREDAAIGAFPVAAKLKHMLMMEDDPTNRLQTWQAHQVEYAVVLSALSRGKLARTTYSANLGREFGKYSINYQFDGKQMVISATPLPNGAQLKLTIPPNPPIK